MSRIPGAALLVGTTALLAACSQTPTSARNIDDQGPRHELTCRSGYVIAYRNGVPTCVECSDSDECTGPDQT
jgi:hypothetical protein